MMPLRNGFSEDEIILESLYFAEGHSLEKVDKTDPWPLTMIFQW